MTPGEEGTQLPTTQSGFIYNPYYGLSGQQALSSFLFRPSIPFNALSQLLRDLDGSQDHPPLRGLSNLLLALIFGPLNKIDNWPRIRFRLS